MSFHDLCCPGHSSSSWSGSFARMAFDTLNPDCQQWGGAVPIPPGKQEALGVGLKHFYPTLAQPEPRFPCSNISCAGRTLAQSERNGFAKNSPFTLFPAHPNVGKTISSSSPLSPTHAGHCWVVTAPSACPCHHHTSPARSWLLSLVSEDTQPWGQTCKSCRKEPASSHIFVWHFLKRGN